MRNSARERNRSLLTEEEAAKYLTISKSFLRVSRSKKTEKARHVEGPKFIRLGRSIRYEKDGLDSWLEEKKTT